MRSLLIPAAALLFAGCTNASGDRISAWEWMRGGGAAETPKAPKRTAERNAAGGGGDTAAKPSTLTGSSTSMGEAGPGQPPDRSPTRNGGGDAVEPEPPVPSVGAVHSDGLMVNNETIRVNDILEPLFPQIEKMSREMPPRSYFDQVRDMIRRQIIEAVAQHLIWRRAKSKLNKDIEPQIDKTVTKIEKERINREFGGSEAKYEKYLKEQNKTRADVRERLRRTVIIDSYLRDNLLPLVPSPRKRELQQYYEAHLGEFTKPSRREMFLIEVPIATFLDRGRPVTETDLSEATRQARKMIDDAAAALADGQPFDEVAKKHSAGVNKESGGAWGFIEAPLQGRWAKPSKRLFELESGQVSEIIEAEKCFFIVKAGTVETGGAISFQDAQPEIVDALRQERFTKLRGDFLQKELDESTIGSLDAFVTEVLKAIPQPLTRP